MKLPPSAIGQPRGRGPVVLETWPARSIPDRPGASLLTVARNTAARARTRAGARHQATAAMQAATDRLDPDAIPDDRLRRLFVRAHPAMDEAVRTPLTLQTVPGLAAAEVARLFRVPPEAMAQRLVRAKRKIREARMPPHDARPGRQGRHEASFLAALLPLEAEAFPRRARAEGPRSRRPCRCGRGNAGPRRRRLPPATPGRARPRPDRDAGPPDDPEGPPPFPRSPRPGASGGRRERLVSLQPAAGRARTQWRQGRAGRC